MTRTDTTGALIVVTLMLAMPVLAEGKSRLIGNLEAGRKQTIVAYGTSLTAAGAWVGELDGVLRRRYAGLATVINSGGSGMWSQWGVQNLDARVLQKNPDAVFIEFCINDSVERFHCPVAQARTNLETMVERVIRSNPDCEIILMTMTPGDKYPPGHTSHRKDIALYHQMYRDVARARGLTLVDHYAHWKALQSRDAGLFQKYVPDSVHPTPEGCATVVTPAILEALGLGGTPDQSRTKQASGARP